MQLGFHGATTMTSDLETDVAATRHAGYQALELWAVKVDKFLADHPREDLKALLDNAAVSPMTLNSIEFIGFRSDAEYAAIRDRCRQLSDIAQYIGCPTIIVVPSPTPDRETPWALIVDEYVRVLRDLSGIAGAYGVRLAFEFLGFGWCSVRTPRGAWEIVQKTARDNVGLVIDAAHFYGGGGLLDEISDALRLMPGLGVVPLNEICARLKAIGYDGACSIELFRPEYWDWDARQVAVKARQAAISVLSPHFRVA